MDVRTRIGESLDALADRLGITPWAVVVGFVAVVTAGAGAWWAFSPPAPPPAEEVLPRVGDATVAAPTTTGTPPTTPATMLVHVDGAVMRPGVHEIGAAARVVDAIEAAGGLRADADRARLNLAAVLSDGQRLWVPVVGEAEPDVVGPDGGRVEPGGGGGSEAGLIDLNTADATTLETLPGIGPSIAAAIIRHRELEGAFQRVEDLLEVAGIGPSRLAQIESLVVV